MADRVGSHFTGHMPGKIYHGDAGMKAVKERSAAIVYLLLFTMTLINYLDRVTLSVAAKPIAATFALSPVQMGYLFSSFLWTYLLCVIPCGMLADKFGAKKVCAGGMAIWSIATVFTGLVSGFGMLLATRLVMGSGEATSYPTGNKFIREQIPPNRRGFATTVLNSGAYAGPAFGAVMIGWLVAGVGWRAAFVVAGLVGIAWLIPWFLYFRNTSEPLSSPAASAELRNQPAGTGIGLRGLLRSTSMWGIALTQGCGVYTQYLFLTWLPSYLAASKGMDIKQAAIYTALPYGCAVLLGIVLGKVSDRMLKPADVERGKRRPMVAIMLLGSSVILLTPFVNNIWAVVALLAISLTGISTAISLNMALANDLLLHNADAARANSLTLVGGNIFGVLAPIVTGYIIAATGSYNYAFVGAGVLLVCGAIISQVMTRARIGTAPGEDTHAPGPVAAS
jgi:ACS family glucarate transporter-like MFS transporter